MGNRTYIFCGGCGMVLGDEAYFDEATRALYCNGCKPEGSEKVFLQPLVSAEIIDDWTAEAKTGGERGVYIRVGPTKKQEVWPPQEVTA